MACLLGQMAIVNTFLLYIEDVGGDSLGFGSLCMVGVPKPLTTDGEYQGAALQLQVGL